MEKSLRRILAVMLSLVMLMSVFAIGGSLVFAESSLTGTGTESDPYQIGTYAQLKEFASIVNGGEASACAILTANIVAKNDPNDENYATDWIPIGDGSGSGDAQIMYNGTFDGQNYTITGLSTPENYGRYAGLGA